MGVPFIVYYKHVVLVFSLLYVCRVYLLASVVKI